MSLIGQDQIPSSGKSLAEASHGNSPLIDTCFDLRGNAGIFHSAGIAGKLFPVVKICESDNGPCLLEFAVNLLIICIVDKIQDRAGLRLAGKDGKLAILERDVGAAGLKKLLQGFRINQLEHTLAAHFMAWADGCEKGVVYPYNIVRLANNGNRHGKIAQTIVFLRAKH